MSECEYWDESAEHSKNFIHPIEGPIGAAMYGWVDGWMDAAVALDFQKCPRGVT